MFTLHDHRTEQCPHSLLLTQFIWNNHIPRQGPYGYPWITVKLVNTNMAFCWLISYDQHWMTTELDNGHMAILWLISSCLHWMNWAIGLISRVFTNGWRDQGSIPGQVISKTQKMVLNTALPNTQHYKVRIKSKVEQSRELNSALLYTLV